MTLPKPGPGTKGSIGSLTAKGLERARPTSSLSQSSTSFLMNSLTFIVLASILKLWNLRVLKWWDSLYFLANKGWRCAWIRLDWVKEIFWPNPPWWVKKIKPNPHGSGWVGLNPWVRQIIIIIIIIKLSRKKYKYKYIKKTQRLVSI